MNKFHAFCIAAPRSGEGKTTLSLALMRLLARQSICVQAFKCGPDYIDPTFHALVTNRVCANLDTWMMGEAEVQRVFSTKSHDANISICEGVMGLFDGKIHAQISHEENTLPPINGSTAHCAQVLGIPIILIINAKGMASSIAALVTGFVSHAQKYNIEIVGIIANNVGSARHAKILEDALSIWSLPPLLGFLPRKEEWRLHERQLGLLPCEESEKDMAWADSIADILEENLNVEKLLSLTQLPRPIVGMSVQIQAKVQTKIQAKAQTKTLGIARDEAFCFYYEANIKALEYIGWEIIYFSPLHDKHLPKADALYFGGGYPEVFAKKLAENKNMRKDIYDFAQANGEIFAECGGYMYLTNELLIEPETTSTKPTNRNNSTNNTGTTNDTNNTGTFHDINVTHTDTNNISPTISYPMCGVIQAIAHMGKKMRSLGYREIHLHANTIFQLDKDNDNNTQKPHPECFHGHEFHWSDIELKEDYPPLATVNGLAHGITYKNVRASYLHFYWASNIFSQKNKP